MIKVILTIFAMFFTFSSLADYVKPEGNIEISKGIFARESVSKSIMRLKILPEVISLYNKSVDIKSNITTVKDANERIIIYINTEGGKKNFINQIIVNTN